MTRKNTLYLVKKYIILKHYWCMHPAITIGTIGFDAHPKHKNYKIGNP